MFRFGKQALGLIKRDAKEAIPLLQHLFYEKKQIELQAEKEGLEKKLNGYRFNERMDELRMLSMRLFKAELAKRYPWRSVRQRFEMRDFRANSSAFNSEYPVILSTTYSIKRILICTRKMCITNDFETGKETENNEKPGLWHDAASGAFRTDGF